MRWGSCHQHGAAAGDSAVSAETGSAPFDPADCEQGPRRGRVGGGEVSRKSRVDPDHRREPIFFRFRQRPSGPPIVHVVHVASRQLLVAFLDRRRANNEGILPKATKRSRASTPLARRSAESTSARSRRRRSMRSFLTRSSGRRSLGRWRASKIFCTWIFLYIIFFAPWAVVSLSNCFY